MAWSDEISDAFSELLSDGAGVTILRKGKQIPAMLGTGISLDQLVNGGESENVNPTVSIARSTLKVAGWNVQQGHTFEVKEAPGHVIKVKSLAFDPADPILKIYCEGEQQ